MRPKGKDRRKFASTLDETLYDKFHKLSEETGINKSKLLDMAIKLLLKDCEGKYIISINLPEDMDNE